MRIGEIAEELGYLTTLIEAPEEQRLAGLLVRKLRVILYKLSGVEKARTLANRGLGALRKFASAFKVSYRDFEVGVEPEPGLASSGDLETDVTDLLLLVGEAARAAGKPVAVLIDEVQYLDQEDLAALIVAFHRIGQRNLPVILFGAGLPQLAAVSGEAKSYAEGLLDYPAVGALDEDAAADAIRRPVVKAGAAIEPSALETIVRRTEGIPISCRSGGPCVEGRPTFPDHPGRRRRRQRKGGGSARRQLLRVRFDRLTPREQEYLRAMAELGPGPHRSGDLAAELGIPVTSAAPIRTALIRKGMIWSPSHGDTAFTVPRFHHYMQRAMPDWNPEG